MTLFGAIGMSESGWDELSQTFTWVASRFSELSDYRIDLELVEVAGDMAYVLWFERFMGSIAGRPVEPVTVRATHIYRREDDEWKIVHRHADNPGNDPRSKETQMTETGSRPFVRAPEEGLTLDAPVGVVTYRARGEETGGALTAIQTVAASGEGPPLHLHAADDEFIYVLEGRLRIRVDEDVHDAPTGSFVFIPKNVPHTWQAAGAGNARFLFGYAPASPGMEQFFERSTDLSADTRLADGFGRFAGDAGMDVLGPPLAQSDP